MSQLLGERDIKKLRIISMLKETQPRKDTDIITTEI